MNCLYVNLCGRERDGAVRIDGTVRLLIQTNVHPTTTCAILHIVLVVLNALRGLNWSPTPHILQYIMLRCVFAKFSDSVHIYSCMYT